MPKIIENVRGLIIDETQKQIAEKGYDNVTIRSIAKGCSLGLGTFYNYFKSKDMLIATFLLEEWNERIGRVTAISEREADPMVIIRNIYDELKDFMESHNSIFASQSAIKSFNNMAGSYHKVLRSQISEPIYKVCLIGGCENPEFLSQFAAEATLTWAVAKKDYDEFAAVIRKLFVK